MKGDGLMVMGDGLMLITENQQQTTYSSSPITIMSFNFDHLLKNIPFPHFSYPASNCRQPKR